MCGSVVGNHMLDFKLQNAHTHTSSAQLLLIINQAEPAQLFCCNAEQQVFADVTYGS